MIYIDILPVLFISIVGAITDIRHGRVNNIHLILTIVMWIIVNVIKVLTSNTESLSPSWITNLWLSLITSVIFYITDIWAPGDSKLFCVIALTFPFFMYPERVGNIFPSLDFVIYAFATGYLVVLVTSLYKISSGKENLANNRVSHKITSRRIISIASNIGFMAAMHTALDIFCGSFYESNRVFCSLFIIGLLCIIQVRAKPAKPILGVLGLLFLITTTILYRTWNSTFTNIIVCIVLSILFDIINDSARTNTYRVISGNDVKPGMILSYMTVLSMQRCIDPNIPHTTTENRRSRITEIQAEAVKTWCKNAKSDIIIVEMIPFAPFIGLAVAIEIIRYLSLVHLEA